MPFRRGNAKAFCVAAQLMALLVLQGYFLTPALLKMVKPAAAGKTCYGSHRLCGCPPERIANKTCCCFRASHSCCHNVEEVASPAGGDADEGAASLRNAPCGLFTDFDMLSLDKLTFLIDSPLPVKNACAGSSCFPPFSGMFADQLDEPPDPPPRIPIHV